MPHVSKKVLKRQVQEELYDSFNLVLSRIDSKEEMQKLLKSMFSETERLMMAKRLGVFILLREKVPENKVADLLGVTRETVSRLKIKAELNGDGYTVAIRKINDEKLLRGLKKMAGSLARYAIRASGGYVKPNPFE